MSAVTLTFGSAELRLSEVPGLIKFAEGEIHILALADNNHGNAAVFADADHGDGLVVTTNIASGRDPKVVAFFFCKELQDVLNNVVQRPNGLVGSVDSVPVDGDAAGHSSSPDVAEAEADTSDAPALIVGEDGGVSPVAVAGACRCAPAHTSEAGV